MSPTTRHTGPQEVISPEELTALVARLHETHDALTVPEVAAALNIPEEAVARALAAVRREAAPTSEPPRRRRRLILFGLATVTLLTAYGIRPHALRWAQLRLLPTARRMEPMPAPSLTLPPRTMEVAPIAQAVSDTRRRIERATPNVVKVTVAGKSYTGENTSGVFGTEGIAALKEAVELDRSKFFVRDPISDDAIRTQLASPRPHAVPGLDFTRITVSGRRGAQTVYIPTIPGPSDGPATLPLSLHTAITDEAARRWDRVADLMTDAMFTPYAPPATPGASR